MHKKRIKTVTKEWRFFNNNIEYYTENIDVKYIRKRVKDNKLFFSVARNEKDFEKFEISLPFNGKDLPPISTGSENQILKEESVEPISLDAQSSQIYKKVDTCVYFEDSYGNVIDDKKSLYKYSISVEHGEKEIFIEGTCYDIREKQKEIEKFVNLILDLKEVKVKEKVPVAIIHSEFYNYFSEAFFGPNIEEKTVWAAFNPEINLVIEEDPELMKPFTRFDDDGLKTKRKYIVKEKIKPVYDLYFAYKYNKEPTGNGFHDPLPNGIGYTYLKIYGENKLKIEELEKVILGYYFIGLHTCDWNSGFVDVVIDFGILYEYGTPTGLVFKVPVRFYLKDVLKKATLLDKKYTLNNFEVYPLVVNV